MNTDTSGFLEGLIPNAIISLILSWSVGLAPAILYRYAIYKGPILIPVIAGR